MPLRLPLVLTLLLAAAAPRAQPASPSVPAQDDVARAKDLFTNAEVAYRLGNFGEALHLYLESLKLARRPSLLFNVAQCYRQLNQRERALFYYKLFLSDWERQRPGEPAPYADEVQSHVAALTHALQEEGKRQKEKEEEEKRRTEERKRDEALRMWRLGLRQARSSAPNLGKLHLTGVTLAGASVLVDGVLKATAPLSGALEVPAGKHTVRVEAPAHHAWTGEIEVTAGGDTRVDVRLEPHPHRSTFWLWSTIAGGVVAAGLEGLAIVYTLKANDHYRDTPPFNDARNVVVAGHVVAGVAAASAVTSLFLYLRSGRIEDGAGRTTVIAPLPRGGQALATFRF